MDKLKIENIIDNAKKYGYDVTIRDVVYSLLRAVLDNDLMCYTVVFGAPQKDNDIECYERMDKVKHLISYFEKSLSNEKDDQQSAALVAALSANKNNAKDGDSENITFEQNKSAMIQLIKRTEDALAEGAIEPDKGLKIIADLRVKLNDKFKVEDKTAEQYIIVQPKFNNICDYTHKECWLQTKEFAKEHWHLIDDPKYNE
jgi:hypothetical protein